MFPSSSCSEEPSQGARFKLPPAKQHFADSPTPRSYCDPVCFRDLVLQGSGQHPSWARMLRSMLPCIHYVRNGTWRYIHICYLSHRLCSTIPDYELQICHDMMLSVSVCIML